MGPGATTNQFRSWAGLMSHGEKEESGTEGKGCLRVLCKNVGDMKA